MNSILYGNLRLELVTGAGWRVDRSPHPPITLTPRPGSAHQTDPIFLAGRAEELDRIRRAIRARHPLQVVGTCGYGKTTLLRYVAANAVAEGLTGFCVYLSADQGSVEDLLHRLVGEIYTTEQRVKLTPSQYAQILSQAQALVILDEAALDPSQFDYLLRILRSCSVLVSSQRPTRSRPIDRLALPGLDEEAALQVIATGLGRPLAGGERSVALRLAQAVDGQPLHLRQAGALAGEGKASLAELADMAERDPGRLDRLSIDALTRPHRQALAMLALAAGALLPAELVGAMGGIAQISLCLRTLHRRGLAEQQQNRFGLPMCNAEHYRQVLLKDLHHTAAVRELVDWLASRSPSAPDSISAASAALAMAEWAAGGEDWPTVVQLIRVVEPVLTLTGRWQASEQALAHGLHAARTIGDHLSEAFFSHEQGTLALCRDELTTARQQLEHALTLRQRHDDRDGAAITRHNLDVLHPSPPAPVRTVRSRLKFPIVVGSSLLAVIALIIGVLTATAATRRSHPTISSSPSAAVKRHHDRHSTNPGQGTGSPTPTGGSSISSNNTSGSPSKPPSIQPANFGSVHFGSSPSVTKVLTVHNPNTQPLVITSTQTALPFSITQDTCLDRPVAGGRSCDITVVFIPAAIGDSSRTLTIESAAGSSAAQLTGTAYVQLTIIFSGGFGKISDGQKFNCTTGVGGQCQQDITGNVTVTATATPPYSFHGFEFCPTLGATPICPISSPGGDITLQADFYYNGKSGSPSPPLFTPAPRACCGCMASAQTPRRCC